MVYVQKTFPKNRTFGGIETSLTELTAPESFTNDAFFINHPTGVGVTTIDANQNYRFFPFCIVKNREKVFELKGVWQKIHCYTRPYYFFLG